MSARVFALPDLGEGLTEAEIVEWLVEEGDEIAIDQPVVVVETAKATVDVPCPYAGRLSVRHGATGEVVQVGAPLVTVGGAPQEHADAPLAGARQYREEELAGADPSKRQQQQAGSDSGSEEGSGAVLIGYGTGAGRTSGSSGRRARRRAISGAASASVAAPVETVAEPVVEPMAEKVQGDQQAVRVISPLVRRLAKDQGVDLAALAARHEHQVLRRADVEQAAGASEDAASAPSSPVPVTSGTQERIPLTGVSRVIADKLSTSRREIPDATTWVDADATELMAAKDALRQAFPDAGIGVLPLLARICVAALQRFPELNASVDLQAQEIVRHGSVHLGFAAQSPRGLVVPVVRDAQSLTTRQLAAALRDLTTRAREGTLSPTELTGGTFTLNNYGVFGVDGSTPIINHPEAAMIGVGRIIERPWVVDHQLAVRQVTQVGLTFDHRVCDGGSAGGFLRAIADGIESPIALLADL